MGGEHSGIPWASISTWSGAICLFIGVLFTLIAAVGLLCLPDAFSRMHAATKPQLLGLIFVCAGITLEMRQWYWLVLTALILILQIIATPVGSQLVGRSLYRMGESKNNDLVFDELEEDLNTSSSADGQ